MGALAGWRLVVQLMVAHSDQQAYEAQRQAELQAKLEVMVPIIASGYAARSMVDPSVVAELSVWTARKIIEEIDAEVAR